MKKPPKNLKAKASPKKEPKGTGEPMKKASKKKEKDPLGCKKRAQRDNGTVSKACKELQGDVVKGLFRGLRTCLGLLSWGVGICLPIGGIICLATVPSADLWYLSRKNVGSITTKVWYGEVWLLFMIGILIYYWLAYVKEGKPKKEKIVLSAETGLGVGVACLSATLWGPRMSTGITGGVLMRALRRSLIHFAGLGCWIATWGTLGSISRFFASGRYGVILGGVASSLLWLFSAEVLGTPKTVALKNKVDELEVALKKIIPCTLLLHAVSPNTLLVYLRGLLEFLGWRRRTGEPRVRSFGDLDDSLCRWIQEQYGRWKNSVATLGRQGCTYGRCGLLLLLPRPQGRLQASSRVLQAWKRISPPTHYLPVPYSLLLVYVSRMLILEEVEGALAMLLAFHCLLRPGEVLGLKIGDLILPPIRDTLSGMVGTVHI